MSLYILPRNIDIPQLHHLSVDVRSYVGSSASCVSPQLSFHSYTELCCFFCSYMSDLKQDAGITLLWSPVISLLACGVLLKISAMSRRKFMKSLLVLQPLGVGWLYVQVVPFDGRAGLDHFTPDSFGGSNSLLSFSWKNRLGFHPCDLQELLQIPVRSSGEQSRGLSCLDDA